MSSPAGGQVRSNSDLKTLRLEHELVYIIYLLLIHFTLQGNSNNFNSRKECFAVCHPQEEDFQLSGSGDDDNDEDVREDDFSKLNIPIWLPFPIAPDSSPNSVCDLVQVLSIYTKSCNFLSGTCSGSRTMSSS